MLAVWATLYLHICKCEHSLLNDYFYFKPSYWECVAWRVLTVMFVCFLSAFFFFFTAIQCTFTLFPSPNSTNVSKLHATHNSINAITTFALISRPVSVHVTVNKHSGLIKYIHSTLTNTIPATLVDSSCHSAH
jgi:hypothetical protein